MDNISPLAPKEKPQLLSVSGMAIGVARTGANKKNSERKDMLLAKFVPETQVAGCLTTSRCPSASVDWCRVSLSKGSARALVVNAGNANAFTGKNGADTVEAIADSLCQHLGVEPQQVFQSSTGVIGQTLDHSLIINQFPELLTRLDSVSEASHDDLWQAAQAIMTTDTFPKAASRIVKLAGVDVHLTGIAKGSGMIAPNMATMLSYIFTDAQLPSAVLQSILRPAVAESFNAITVDGDTSTSDTVLAFATGAASARGQSRISNAGDPALRPFRQALASLCEELAVLIVKDGEGARKLIEIHMHGATSKTSAKRIAFSVANSPLVKTAIAGEDANWGRVVAAVGKAGEPADRDRLSIRFGEILVAEQGQPVEADEEALSNLLKQDKVTIIIDLNLGKGSARVWTCDLTERYIEINGSYRS